jgi:DNA-binding transcriptional LysR family regulator
MRRLPDEEDLVARKLGRMAFAVYARTLEPEAVILPPEDPNLSRQASLIARFAEGRPVAARIGDLPIRHQAARTGLGAAVLPCWLGDADPDLVRVMEPPDDMTEDVFLVLHRRNRNRAPVATVAAALADLFRKERDALAGIRRG